MTPKEEKWLAEYRRREAAEAAKMQRRALWFWGMLFTAWAVIGLFQKPESRFSFSDSLLLMTIIINAGTTIRELIRNRRIAAGEKSAETTDNDTAE